MTVASQSMNKSLSIFIFSAFFFTGCVGSSAKDYYRSSLDIAEKRKYNEAILLLDKAILKDPTLKNAYLQRGYCYEQINQDSLAENDYYKLLKIDNRNTTALYYIGLIEDRKQHFEKAIEYYNKAFVTKGADDPSDTLKPQIIIDLNKNGIMNEAASFDIPGREIFYARGLAYYSARHNRRAYVDFKQCLNENYNLGECHYMMGLCWLGGKDKNEACSEFRQAATYGDSLAIAELALSCK
ncbi:MAG: tetratricopeptide repeat protein [Ferruginibacter sp.]